MLKKICALIALPLMITACSGGDGDEAETAPPPWVKTQPLQRCDKSQLSLSGTVRGRHEVPLAFEVGGRIAARHVNAGEGVTAGETLFELDPRDLIQELDAMEARQAAAETALALAESDLQRNRELVEKNYLSQRDLDRSELAVREARTRLDAARARTRQAKNRLDYATLAAQVPGVLIEVLGEAGQVVSTGQTMAVLAEDGPREVEVFFPHNVEPQAAGEIAGGEHHGRALSLRESAGAADPESRTWRARYRIEGNGGHLPLGSIVRVHFDTGGLPGAVTVPVSALDERGEGPRVWRVIDGRAHPFPVQVMTMDTETAAIRTDLPEGATIIVVGTHLLHPGMPVRELHR